MAFSHGSSAQLFLDDTGGTEREFTTYLTDGGLDNSLDTAETTALSNTAKAYIAGLKDHTMSCAGHYDPTAEGYLNGIHGNRASVQVKYFPAGSASGRTFYDGTAICTSLNIKSDVSDRNAIEFELQFITSPRFGTV